MNQNWPLDADHIEIFKAFIDSQKDSPFVKKRASRNLLASKPKVEKPDFWKQLVVCILTSKQPSGPGGAVFRFATTEPFPFAYSHCLVQNDIREFGKQTLTDFRGIRFVNRIPEFMAVNLELLENGLWQKTMDALERLRLNQNKACERETAGFVRRNFDGIGPKQSRNVLQCLGLTRYEIPVDSRVTAKLAEFGFPVHLKLDSERSYCRVLDDIQELCDASSVPPCILDAALFASEDDDGWTSENVEKGYY